MAGKGMTGDVVSEVKRYADLRVEEVKLKATKGLSAALGQVCAWFVIIAVLVIVLGLLAFALLQWLNVLVGAPWGTFIVCGAFTIALVVLFAARNRLFRGKFIRLFSDVFHDDETVICNAAQLERALGAAKGGIDQQERIVRSKLQSNLALGLIRGVKAAFFSPAPEVNPETPEDPVTE